MSSRQRRVVNSQIGTINVSDEEELSPELKEFIDQLIVPLLVELMKNGHLYSAEAPRYDDDTEGLAQAA